MSGEWVVIDECLAPVPCTHYSVLSTEYSVPGTQDLVITTPHSSFIIHRCRAPAGAEAKKAAQPAEKPDTPGGAGALFLGGRRHPRAPPPAPLPSPPPPPPPDTPRPRRSPPTPRQNRPPA